MKTLQNETAPAIRCGFHTFAKHKVSPVVADAIEALRKALSESAGSDFAFTVSMHGNVVSASNAKNGDLRPFAR